MSKTISAGMRTHLDQTVTSLAALWRITRSDGQEFFLTSHDADLLFESNLYTSKSGYNRSAISNNATLSVDNLEVEGIFSEIDVDEAELRAGMFDFAEIKISLVNWKDLSQGDIKLRRGRLGEVSFTQLGFYRAELRGLTQQLSQNIIDIYTNECRADLGDSKCKIAILPNVLGRSQAVLVGEAYRVVTGSTTGIGFSETVRNGSFEFDAQGTSVAAIIGWTIISGNWDIHTTQLGLAPFVGSQYLEGGDSTSGELQQDVEVENFGADLISLDAGNATLDFSIRRANSDINDTGRVIVEFLNAAKGIISTPLDTGFEAIAPLDTWVQRSFVATAIPTLTRFVRISLLYNKITGGEANTSFDAVTMQYDDTVATNGFHDIYENRIYRVITAGTTAVGQPVYDTIIGNDTTDGTAVLRAEDAFMRHAEIADVQSNREIFITVTEARAVDGWFDGGGLEFESGLNIGRVQEVKNWIQSTGKIALFLSTPFITTPGTKIRLYRGCDKSLDTCIVPFDNVLNFQGEPFIPGVDAVVGTPDAI